MCYHVLLLADYTTALREDTWKLCLDFPGLCPMHSSFPDFNLSFFIVIYHSHVNNSFSEFCESSK